ncbi:MAG TPA: hypothetical protein VN646_26785 [Candidatus Acidoferrum sp.]|jgi:hypothetical protein|nr:hypothetical protein [Candidatus Acidoferrum sp.]
MLTGDMGNVQQRLARLERSNRRWRRVTLLVACAGALLLATFPQAPSLAQPRVVAAQRFVLLSPGGQAQGATLDFTARGPELVLFDPGGRPRLRVGVEEAGPGLHLLDARGAARASLALFEGEPGFVLYDGGLKVRAVISMAGDQPSVVLLDENKRRTFRAP